MTSPTELRCSFDNILKELNDICKGIDNITENFPGDEINTDETQPGLVHTQLQRNHIKNININNTSFTEYSNDDYEAKSHDQKPEESGFDRYKNGNIQSQLSSNNGERNSEIFLSFEKNQSLEINEEKVLHQTELNEGGSLRDETRSTSSMKILINSIKKLITKKKVKFQSLINI